MTKTIQSLIQIEQLHPDEAFEISQSIHLTKYDPIRNKITFEIISKEKKRLARYLSWPNAILTYDDQITFGEKAKKTMDSV